MFAEVYPLSKLPRRFAYFDYALPDQHTLKVGDLVRITLRGRSSLGVIRALKKTSGVSQSQIRQIDALVLSRYLSQADIRRFEDIAKTIGQSVSTILCTAFSDHPDHGVPHFISATKVPKFPTALVPAVQEYLAQITTSSSTAISDGSEVAYALIQALRRRAKKQMLVLVPRERDAELLAERIQFGEQAAILTGKTARRERARIIEAWRTGKLQTLVGTRQASLLPAQELEHIVIGEAGNDEHLNDRRNPRFDAREAAKLLAHQHSAKTIWIDSLPRLEEAASGLTVAQHSEADIRVISLRSQEEYTADPLLTETIVEEIKKALQSQKKVLLFLNRKGVAKRLQCAACGHIPLCGVCGHVPTVRVDDLVCTQCKTEMWIPTQCPSCGKAKIALRGVGGAKVEETLKRLFPDVLVTRFEKGGENNPAARIILATEFFFSSVTEPFAPREFGLVADLMTDIGLHASDFRAPETTVRKMHRLIHFGRYQGAPILFQTWIPDVISGMLDLQHWTQSELAIRQQYQLPPYGTRYLVDDKEVTSLDYATLTDRSKVIIDGPYAKSHESTS